MRIRTQLAAGGGGLLALAVAGCLVPTRATVPATGAALALAVVVSMAAAAGGRWAGIITGGVAAASYDFLLTRPYGTFAVDAAAPALSAVLLLVLGLLAGEVAERLHEARFRRSDMVELARLRRLGALASLGEEDDDLATYVADDLVDTLHLRACWFEPWPFPAELPDLPVRGRSLPRDGVVIPVWVADRPVGRFVLAPTAGVGVPIERRLVALALVDQLAVVLAVRAA